MNDHPILFNPNPRIERLTLTNGAQCLVIDDALRQAEELLQFSTDHAAQFRNVDFNAYPGVFLASAAATRALGDFFTQHIRRLFDARRTLHLHCRLSMITLPPSDLRPFQRMCHRDVPVLDSRHSIQASILYLFKDSAMGGTSFYEASQSEDETRRLFHDASTLSIQEFDRRHDIQPGYMSGSNRYFTCVGTVPAAWNRMIFYDGYVLHSGDITEPSKLSRDPAKGRLTLNGFFTSRRNLLYNADPTRATM